MMTVDVSRAPMASLTRLALLLLVGWQLWLAIPGGDAAAADLASDPAVVARARIMESTAMLMVPGGEPIVVLQPDQALRVHGRLMQRTGLASAIWLWVSAEAADGPTGSQNPLQGYVPAGAVSLTRGAVPRLSRSVLPLPSSSAPNGGGSVTLEPETRSTIVWLPESVARHWPAIQRAAERHGIDPELLAIVVLVESGGYSQARSPAGAMGLAQLMPGTAAEMATAAGISGLEPSAILDPELNLDLGARYLAEQLGRFGQADDADWARSVALAAAAYNAGPGRVMAARTEAALPAETQRYQRWVSGMWA